MSSELPRPIGRYTLERLLARGGMGEIYLANIPGPSGMAKPCVIKRLPQGLAHDEEFVTRFLDEARVMTSLSHANIAQVFEVGREGDEFFLALEFVNGRDLRQILARCFDRRLRLPVEFGLYILQELLRGLGYAHRKGESEGKPLGLIHRDVCPQNIMVSFEGEVKLIDFGLAKSALKSLATSPTILLGKVAYMSPEQARREKLDRRSDLYSAGVVFFEAISGRRRYTEKDPQELLRRVRSPGPFLVPQDLSLPASVAKILKKALESRPEERYQSAEEFRRDVSSAIAEVAPTLEPEQLGSFLRNLFPPTAAEKPQTPMMPETTRRSEYPKSSKYPSTASLQTNQLPTQTLSEAAEPRSTDTTETPSLSTLAGMVFSQGEKNPPATDDYSPVNLDSDDDISAPVGATVPAISLPSEEDFIARAAARAAKTSAQQNSPHTDPFFQHPAGETESQDESSSPEDPINTLEMPKVSGAESIRIGNSSVLAPIVRPASSRSGAFNPDSLQTQNLSTKPVKTSDSKELNGEPLSSPTTKKNASGQTPQSAKQPVVDANQNPKEEALTPLAAPSRPKTSEQKRPSDLPVATIKPKTSEQKRPSDLPVTTTKPKTSEQKRPNDLPVATTKPKTPDQKRPEEIAALSSSESPNIDTPKQTKDSAPLSAKRPATAAQKTVPPTLTKATPSKGATEVVSYPKPSAKRIQETRRRVLNAILLFFGLLVLFAIGGGAALFLVDPGGTKEWIARVFTGAPKPETEPIEEPTSAIVVPVTQVATAPTTMKTTAPTTEKVVSPVEEAAERAISRLEDNLRMQNLLIEDVPGLKDAFNKIESSKKTNNEEAVEKARNDGFLLLQKVKVDSAFVEKKEKRLEKRVESLKKGNDSVVKGLLKKINKEKNDKKKNGLLNELDTRLDLLEK